MRGGRGGGEWGSNYEFVWAKYSQVYRLRRLDKVDHAKKYGRNFWILELLAFFIFVASHDQFQGTVIKGRVPLS